MVQYNVKMLFDIRVTTRKAHLTNVHRPRNEILRLESTGTVNIVVHIWKIKQKFFLIS